MQINRNPQKNQASSTTPTKLVADQASTFFAKLYLTFSVAGLVFTFLFVLSSQVFAQSGQPETAFSVYLPVVSNSSDNQASGTIPPTVDTTIEEIAAATPSAPVSTPETPVADATTEATTEPAPTEQPAREYELNANELQVQEFLTTDPNQQRVRLELNATLCEVAKAKAIDMATRRYVNHTNPDGHGPNYLVQEAGYELPSYYSQKPDGNNIESLAVGYTNPKSAWNAWMASDGHRSHLLGEYNFYAEQYEYGIGYYFDARSPYRHYWVVLIAKPGP